MATVYNNRAQFDGDWAKVFRHRSSDGDFFGSGDSWAEARFTNPNDPMANKYSILEYLYKFQRNGKFTFKVVYPDYGSGITNIWSQTSNPVTQTTSHGGVTDYTPISIESTLQGWGGLEYSGASTFLDGTVNSGDWWWAIGSKNNYDTSNPNFPGPGGTVELVELWVKHTNV